MTVLKAHFRKTGEDNDTLSSGVPYIKTDNT